MTVNRISGTEKYPADFLLVCAMNPCKCGFYPDLAKCRCTPGQRRRYLSGISGPFLDRIDIGVEVPLKKLGLRERKRKGESSAHMLEKVLEAVRMQEERFRGTGIRRNSEMSGRMVEVFCRLDKKEEEFLDRDLTGKDISARGADRILRLSRTIADLDGRENISVSDIAQAASFRSFLSYYWRRDEL